MWAAASSETYETIESISMPESPATEIGRRDAMTMVLVDVVRNVVRGTELAVGKDSEIVQRFSEEHPALKDLRDRFEHYEDYVRCTVTHSARAGGAEESPWSWNMTASGSRRRAEAVPRATW